LREEREKVCEFISEQLRKRYIRSLKLLQIVPVFFVKISDIAENIGTKKVFTKMDLR